MSDKQQLIDDFNSTLLDFVLNFSRVCPKSIIGKNANIIKGILKDPENKQICIDIFTTNVLVFKPEIIRGDDDFFLTKEYDEDLSDFGISQNDFMSHVFEFKDIWKDLKDRNKHMVKEYMKILCMLADDYFILIDQNGAE